MKRCVKKHEVVQPLNESYRFIPLTKGQTAIVDVEDFDFINQWNWSVSKSTNGFYAARKNESGKMVYMHRLVINCPPGKETDHRSHDTLDNRKQNLRECTHDNNVCNVRISSNNTSGFKGVCWHKKASKWRSAISINDKTKHLGLFASKEEAAKAYDDAAKIYHGSFAQLNYVEP
jgi:hypothetical protein